MAAAVPLRPAWIRSTWHVAIARLGVSDAEALVGLVHRQHQCLADGDLGGLRRDLEAQGAALARRGVPEERAFLALALDTDLNLSRFDERGWDASAMAVAAARIAAAGQLALHAGYEQARAEGTSHEKALDDRPRARSLHEEMGSLDVKRQLQEMAADLERGQTRQACRRLEETAAMVTRRVEAATAGTPRLTAREREVLTLLAEGLSVKEVAVRLDRSVKTAAVHTYNLMHKLGVHNRAALVRYAIAHHLVPVPDPDETA
jgi:DNA-binding CsgD family transcriptional regulator